MSDRAPPGGRGRSPSPLGALDDVVDLEGAPQRRTDACAFANRASAGCGLNSDTSGECQGAKGRSAFKAILIDPILADRAWSPARPDEALIAIGTVAVRLAEALRVPVTAYSIALLCHSRLHS